MSEEILHYCEGHKEKHKAHPLDWKKRAHTGWFCRSFMYCGGCKEVHTSSGYQKLIDGEWYCDKWVRPAALTPAQKMKNLSPQEVVSGVHFGLERQKIFGKDTEDHSVIHKQQVKALKEAL